MTAFKIQCINMMLDRMIAGGLTYNEPDDVIAGLLVYHEWPLAKETDESLMNMVWDEYADEFNDYIEEYNGDLPAPERTMMENWIMKQTPYNWVGKI